MALIAALWTCETASGQEKGASRMRSTSSWSWKSPLDRRLTSRMATRPLQFTGMQERNSPKPELLQTCGRGILT